ncbi:hypothetical protein [Natronoarchaeum rubrum]|uniref:hypothetical protein n=1 Tax=Natronoarchaeum rubrum TaxID=755311 RepID=UPI002112AFDC|nr:hypothetical protein [Natronoarchaeum rubrum]
MSETPDLTQRLEEYLDALPAESYTEWGDKVGVAGTSAESAKDRLNECAGVDVQKVDGEWCNVAGDRDVQAGVGDGEDDDDGPDPDDLTGREEYIVRELQQGVELDDLADDLDERESVVRTHLDDLEDQGWRICHDEDAGLFEIEGDHTLRSSEHKGTRTRKANRWWEVRHNALERQWKRLDPADVSLVAEPGNEDWVTHMTDLHAGDVVRDYAGELVYETEDIPTVVEYITEQSLSLASKHNADYDTAHLLYGGDMVTNEAIYKGQFEDLDAWLDEQADVIQQALIEQIITFSEHFDAVNVVCQIGNHGVNRADGTSKHNNADLLVYKAIRNFIHKSQEHWGRLDNVRMKIGEARPYTPVELRGGKLHGHLRHGQDRKPQAETSARLKEWLSTLLDTINSSWGSFDVAWMGHHHVSGNIPWNGPPIIVSGSPKPGGDYVEKLGVKGAATQPQEIAHCHGVSDEGITSIWPIDTRHYER